MTYPPEIKAHALALIQQGYSGQRTHREIVKVFGENEVPDVRTVQLWRSELQISSPEQDAIILENSRQIARHAQRLIIDTLEVMEPDPKQLANLNIVAGTSIDKIHQHLQLSRGPDVHQHLTLLIKQAEIDIRAGRAPLAEELAD